MYFKIRDNFIFKNPILSNKIVKLKSSLMSLNIL